jgi:hypothetical protein
MKDAFGGILNLVLIALFLVIIEGVLGFIVSYSKAFKMKNIVISAFEQYEASGCTSNDESTACRKKITEGAKSIAYSPTSISCPSGYASIGGYFCCNVDSSGVYGTLSSNRSSNHYTFTNQVRTYSIITQVDINIPIIQNIMGLSIFQVSGQTREIQLQTK